MNLIFIQNNQRISNISNVRFVPFHFTLFQINLEKKWAAMCDALPKKLKWDTMGSSEIQLIQLIF
jgi:hypothetical protein